MTIYDTTFILNPQLEETGLDSNIKETVDLINTQGGKIVKENRMGMRRLAYEINKLTQGYYVNLVFEGEGAIVKEMERRFRLNESCLRFLTCLYKEASPKVDDSRPQSKEGKTTEAAPAPKPDSKVVTEAAPAPKPDSKVVTEAAPAPKPDSKVVTEAAPAPKPDSKVVTEAAPAPKQDSSVAETVPAPKPAMGDSPKIEDVDNETDEENLL